MLGRWLIALLAALVVLGSSPAAGVAQPSYPHCPPGQAPQFVFGFATLAGALGGAMGQPVECEHANPDNGDSLQQTTTGLAFYRKATNTPTFTTGYEHWALTEAGLVYWTGDSIDPPPARPADAIATLTTSGWATVEEIVGPETLIVQNDLGQRFGVWQIGIIGPAESQGDWRQRATEEHERLLQPGARVWLQAEPGLDNPADQIALRHVFREDEPDTPLAARLLETGYVWVFPHTIHAYVREFADRQAEAVVARAGAWGESGSSAVFRPRGETHGGFPINPRAEPALEALDASPLGHDELVAVNRFPVEIGVSDLSDGVLGAFFPRFYSIQLAPELLTAEPKTVAAVLLHELVHARQMVERGGRGRSLDCFRDEQEAFAASARYWLALFGREGKARPSHWLDEELNETLREYVQNQLDARVRSAYGHQCGDG